MPKPSKLARTKVRVWRAESANARLEAATVQAGMGGHDNPDPTERPVTAAIPDEPAGKRTLKQINSELSEIAAKQEPSHHDRLRLEEIVSEAGRVASKGPAYQRLYDRALRIQTKTIFTRPGGNRRIGGGPAGLVKNPELSQGGREVLGGLPSSRRRH